MNRVSAALALVAATVASHPALAQQQQQCAPAKEAAVFLESDYGETLLYAGVMPSGALMATTANLETGTWTLLVIDGGVACIVAAGENFSGVKHNV